MRCRLAIHRHHRISLKADLSLQATTEVEVWCGGRTKSLQVSQEKNSALKQVNAEESRRLQKWLKNVEEKQIVNDSNKENLVGHDRYGKRGGAMPRKKALLVASLCKAEKETTERSHYWTKLRAHGSGEWQLAVARWLMVVSNSEQKQKRVDRGQWIFIWTRFLAFGK